MNISSHRLCWYTQEVYHIWNINCKLYPHVIKFRIIQHSLKPSVFSLAKREFKWECSMSHHPLYLSKLWWCHKSLQLPQRYSICFQLEGKIWCSFFPEHMGLETKSRSERGLTLLDLINRLHNFNSILATLDLVGLEILVPRRREASNKGTQSWCIRQKAKKAPLTTLSFSHTKDGI